MKTFVLFLCLFLCLGTSHSQNNAQTCSYCDTSGGTCTAKTGYVTCSCLAGYAGNGTSCTPISSCTTDTCCSQGYTWDSRVGYKVCTDVNECADPTLNLCSPNSTCVNKVGIYLCGNNRTIGCPNNACAFDQDCLRNGSSVQCADPCTNYKILDGASRLSSINSTGVFATDRYYFGWFRFNGTKGLRMQQGCIGPVKCGSAEPFTVNGSHPALGQGVVMMNLLSNAVAGCTAAGTIPVKACPGGFYVYKLTGSLSSEVYCTDPAGFVVPTLPPTTTTRPTTTTTTPTTTTPTTTRPTTTTTPTTTTPTTTRPTTTTTTPTTTTPTTTRPTTTTTTPTTTTRPTTTTTPTTPVRTTTAPQQNFTVTTVRTIKSVSFISTITRINGTDATNLELNESTSVYTEIKYISPLSIRTTVNNSVTPSYSRTSIGASNPVTYTNMSPAQVSSNDTTVANMQGLQYSMFVSVPPRTIVTTETSNTNINNVTSTTTTTTITTEQIVVKV